MKVTTNDMKAGYVKPGDMVVYNPGVKWISTGSDVYVFGVEDHWSYAAQRTLRGEIILSNEHGESQESFRGEDLRPMSSMRPG